MWKSSFRFSLLYPGNVTNICSHKSAQANQDDQNDQVRWHYCMLLKVAEFGTARTEQEKQWTTYQNCLRSCVILILLFLRHAAKAKLDNVSISLICFITGLKKYRLQTYQKWFPVAFNAENPEVASTLTNPHWIPSMLKWWSSTWLLRVMPKMSLNQASTSCASLNAVVDCRYGLVKGC